MGSIVADGVKTNSNSLIGAVSVIAADEQIPKNSQVMGCLGESSKR
jgi:carbonic anhydrase/acetyltransferase-like protein (isoleucine patch superfamily)